MAENVRRFGRLKPISTRQPVRWTEARAAPRRRRPDVLSMIGITGLAFTVSAVGFGWLMGGLEDRPAAAVLATSAPTVIEARFGMCMAGRGNNCVIDGDTVRIGGTIVRIADIDTPEVRNYGCAAEKTLGDRATARMLALVNAGPFTVEPYARDEDQYGRKLRVLGRDGSSLGMVLVAEGLARPWGGARRPWC